MSLFSLYMYLMVLANFSLTDYEEGTMTPLTIVMNIFWPITLLISNGMWLYEMRNG